MFHGSTHRKHWILPNLNEVDKNRLKCIENYGEKLSKPGSDFLSIMEHKVICKHYEKMLFNLCMQFQPSLPYSVLFTTFVYFKRIYLKTSVMEHRPRDMISVCLYMACKVEEYNISVDKFIMIYPEADRSRMTDIILKNEMGLMKLLNYHLIVHSPKRALEGFFIDIKTRFQNAENVDEFREISNQFLNAILFCDVVLLYAPSQIALAALYAASKELVRNYILHTLAPGEQGQSLFAKVEDIIKLVNNKIVCDIEHVALIEDKLQKLPNPNSGKTKKRKMSTEDGDDEDMKRQKSSDS